MVQGGSREGSERTRVVWQDLLRRREGRGYWCEASDAEGERGREREGREREREGEGEGEREGKGEGEDELVCVYLCVCEDLYLCVKERERVY